jgi:hypothetical protein
MEKLKKKLSTRYIYNSIINNKDNKIILYCIAVIGSIFSSAIINPNISNNSGAGDNVIAYAQPINGNSNSSGAGFSVNGQYSDKAPTFLDAYWTNNPRGNSTVPTNNPLKTEIGPGDGASTLAVVLVNRGRSDITGVTGYLDLPSGFGPIAGKNNGTSQSVGSSYSVVKAGNTFIIYFDMNVLKQAKVGGYSTSLNLKYTKILEVGELMTKISVPFRLTGKVILNTMLKNTVLIPGMPNDIKIALQNVGTANAAGVVVTIIGVTGSSINSGGSGITTINAATDNTNSNSNLNNTAAATSAGKQQQQPSIPAANLGAETFNVGTIPANGTIEVNPIVYPTASAGETVQNLNLQVSYGDAYGNQKIINPQIGFVISPNPPQSVLNLTTNNGNALILTAGKIQNMNFTLANNDKKPITNVVASLDSQSTSMKILGNSRWTMQTMSQQSKLNLSTKVFASANIVSQPVVLTLTVQYISAGQSKLDKLNLGAYITGEIKIRAYDISVNKIGNVPNLVGNLLNEGNTVGLFTTVEMVNQTSSTIKPTKKSLSDFVTFMPTSQYLGDLSADSPLPFSIPLSINNKTIAAISSGIYPVTLKITYSDDLKIRHQLILNDMVNFLFFGQPGSRSGYNNFFGFGIDDKIIVIATIVGAAIAIVTLYIVMRKRSRSRKLESSNKEKIADPFLDGISSSSSVDEDIFDDVEKKEKTT